MLPARAAADSVLLQVESLDQQHIQVVMTNRGAESVSFLRWGSPFEAPLSNDLFQLRAVGSGLPVVFTGRLIKRADPLPEDFVELSPGAVIDAVIPLPRYYDLPMTGAYEVRLSWSMQSLADDHIAMVNQTSNTIVTDLLQPPATLAALPPVFDSCSADQQSVLQEVFTQTENLSLVARDGLAGLTEDGRHNSPRYQQWFGAYSADRFERVLGTYRRIIEVVNDQRIRLSCDCDRSDWFAFVYPAEEYDIYLCPAFWRAPLLGRDSQAGTIIHELTHFPSIAGASDHAYSTEAVRLPPDLAVDNADNYEYFAENVPALPIFNGVVFSWLTRGVEVSGTLLSGQSSFLKVAGAELVELRSDTGDADLYVYATAAADVPVCSSRADADNGNTLDACATDSTGVAYIEVVASSDTSYRIVADTAPLIEVQGADDNTEPPNDPLTPTLTTEPTDDAVSPAVVVGGGGAITGAPGVLWLCIVGWWYRRRRVYIRGCS